MDARIQLHGLGLRFAPVGATECPPDIQRPAKHEQVAIFRQKNERIANVFRALKRQWRSFSAEHKRSEDS